MKQLGSDEARRDWRDLLDAVQANPDAAIQILRYDKPVAVVVSAVWYAESMRIRKATARVLTEANDQFIADVFREVLNPVTQEQQEGEKL